MQRQNIQQGQYQGVRQFNALGLHKKEVVVKIKPKIVQENVIIMGKRYIQNLLYTFTLCLLIPCMYGQANFMDSLIVTNVVDGDTFYAAKDNIEYKFRLLGIDAPESCHPFKGIEPLSIEAKQSLELMISNGFISVEFELQRQDQYGRYLVYVFSNDLLVNGVLLKEGLADVYMLNPNMKYSDQFEKNVALAKSMKVGIWSRP